MQIKITSKEMRAKTKSLFGEGQILYCTELWHKHHFNNLFLKIITYTQLSTSSPSPSLLKPMKASLSFIIISIIIIITTANTDHIMYARKQIRITNSLHNSNFPVT